MSTTHDTRCPPDCGHRPEEHTAFDLGSLAGRAGADPDTNPYPCAVNPCGEWWAWSYGHSAGDCDRDNGPPIDAELYEAWLDVHRQLTGQGFTLTHGPLDGIPCQVVVVTCGELLMGYSRTVGFTRAGTRQVHVMQCNSSSDHDVPACKQQEPEDFGARDEARRSWQATRARHHFKAPTYGTRRPIPQRNQRPKRRP